MDFATVESGLLASRAGGALELSSEQAAQFIAHAGGVVIVDHLDSPDRRAASDLLPWQAGTQVVATAAESSGVVFSNPANSGWTFWIQRLVLDSTAGAFTADFRVLTGVPGSTTADTRVGWSDLRATGKPAILQFKDSLGGLPGTSIGVLTVGAAGAAGAVLDHAAIILGPGDVIGIYSVSVNVTFRSFVTGRARKTG